MPTAVESVEIVDYWEIAEEVASYVTGALDCTIVAGTRNARPIN